MPGIVLQKCNPDGLAREAARWLLPVKSSTAIALQPSEEKSKFVQYALM